MKSHLEGKKAAAAREAIRSAARDVKSMDLALKAAEDFAHRSKLKLKTAKKSFKLVKKAARQWRKKLKKAHQKLDAAITAARGGAKKSKPDGKSPNAKSRKGVRTAASQPGGGRSSSRRKGVSKVGKLKSRETSSGKLRFKPESTNRLGTASAEVPTVPPRELTGVNEPTGQ